MNHQRVLRSSLAIPMRHHLTTVPLARLGRMGSRVAVFRSVQRSQRTPHTHARESRRRGAERCASCLAGRARLGLSVFGRPSLICDLRASTTHRIPDSVHRTMNICRLLKLEFGECLAEKLFHWRVLANRLGRACGVARYQSTRQKVRSVLRFAAQWFAQQHWSRELSSSQPLLCSETPLLKASA